jgi:hypothetical protein
MRRVSERVLATLAGGFRALADRHLPAVDDATAAAEHLVGMLFSIPVNRSMFTGDDDFAATPISFLSPGRQRRRS